MATNETPDTCAVIGIGRELTNSCLGNSILVGRGAGRWVCWIQCGHFPGLRPAPGFRAHPWPDQETASEMALRGGRTQVSFLAIRSLCSPRKCEYVRAINTPPSRWPCHAASVLKSTPFSIARVMKQRLSERGVKCGMLRCL